MMLYIVRHGQAHSKQEDPERRLTLKGREDVRKVTLVLQKQNPAIDAIYHSGKTRAQETADIIYKQLGLHCLLMRKDHLNADDDIQGIYQKIKETSQNIMIVGHLPFVAKLTCQLICGQREGQTLPFSAGSMAVLKRKDELWKLADFISPSSINA